MLFAVLDAKSKPPDNTRGMAFLVTDYWDDWSKYRTQFYLHVSDDNGELHGIGSVKIGQLGLLPSEITEPGRRAPILEQTFTNLDERYFSVGQDETYYESLNRLSRELREAILIGLRDCAFNIGIFRMAQHENVMVESLLRSVSKENVLNRFHRLATGDEHLTEFQFQYRFARLNDDSNPPAISFNVKPRSEPPTNVHVLIGRNGVGKTRCIQSMASAICTGDGSAEEFGSFERLGNNKDQWSFAGLIVVSFSAFDSFLLPPSSVQGLKVDMVGLRRRKDDKTETGSNIESDVEDLSLLSVKRPNELAEDFCKSFGKCRSRIKAERWLTAVEMLGNDPLFAESGIAQLMDKTEEEWWEEARSLFRRLSSGHAIVLLAITRLVELVNERTFVLLDEPEGHLHPPLLSTFVRAISELLISRNGVALVATHSPVVLQEVPKSCVWVLQRSGNTCVAERPPIETFGENVGVLTSTVFGLEVTSSGFHQLLKQAVLNGNTTYEMIMDHFDQQLGAEAKAIARSLLDSREATRSEEE